MESAEFKEDFLESIKAAAAVSGEGSCASFVDSMSQYLIEAEVLSDFTPSFYKGKSGRSNYRIDGYVYDDFDNTMNLIIADYDGYDTERRMTKTMAEHDFRELLLFLNTALKTSLYKEIEMSTPCSDLVDFLRRNEKNIRKYRLIIFTDADMSSSLKTVDIEDYNAVPVEGQVWDVDRMFRICCSEQGRQIIEINFKDYCDDGIPCLEASKASTDQYTCYLGVVPGTVLADIYDKFGSKLLEGNVRSFLSTKVAVNKKIRATINNNPRMFFAFNNGISATAMGIVVENTDHGRFITYARDFQIINGGQTTASISNARYKDKAEIADLYVQMKLTALDEMSSTDEADELIRNISRSSNSQNKVSDADFFAAHPFHKRMEQISRMLFAPAVGGEQYETKWFYERARGQYLQEQMRLTPAKKRQFVLQHPKNKVITKTDLAKVQNSWLGNPHIVSKGAQTNFMAFAEYIDDRWNSNDTQFNELYFQKTAALILILQYLERNVSKQPWYEGGYRANIIYYTMALFHRLIRQQYSGSDLDLMIIWNHQEVPEQVGKALILLAELVLKKITDPDRPTANVTQWCKREACWDEVKKINFNFSDDIKSCLITTREEREAQQSAKKEQKEVNEISAQAAVVLYPADFWNRLSKFCQEKHLGSPTDITALSVACMLPYKLPNSYQSKRLLALLEKAVDEGFKKEV